jgi:hypothetical protein
MSVPLSGRGRFPGLPSLRFCSIGFGGLGMVASYPIIFVNHFFPLFLFRQNTKKSLGLDK